MHRIDGPGATVDNKFTEGDPAGGVPATLVTGVWLNDIQENLMAVLAAAGVAPTKGRAADLLDSLKGRLIGVQLITSSGTYTPTLGMRNIYVKGVGGSGGTGGCAATSSTQLSISGGSASGSYAEAWLGASDIGVSKSVIIGGAGAAGAPSGAGGSGGTTSLGSLMICPGGGGSAFGTAFASTAFVISAGGQPGTISTGGNILNTAGSAGLYAISISNGTLSGSGANSPFGSGAVGLGIGNTGSPGSGYGAGASGSANASSSGARPGSAGSPGLILILEYA